MGTGARGCRGIGILGRQRSSAGRLMALQHFRYHHYFIMPLYLVEQVLCLLEEALADRVLLAAAELSKFLEFRLLGR